MISCSLDKQRKRSLHARGVSSEAIKGAEHHRVRRWLFNQQDKTKEEESINCKGKSGNVVGMPLPIHVHSSIIYMRHPPSNLSFTKLCTTNRLQHRPLKGWGTISSTDTRKNEDTLYMPVEQLRFNYRPFLPLSLPLPCVAAAALRPEFRFRSSIVSFSNRFRVSNPSMNSWIISPYR